MAEDLLDIDPPKLASALKVARLECKFFPKPAEILEFVRRENKKPQIRPYPGAPGPNDQHNQEKTNNA